MSKQVALSLFFSVYHVFRYICGFILCILGISVIQICFQIFANMETQMGVHWCQISICNFPLIYRKLRVYLCFCFFL